MTQVRAAERGHGMERPASLSQLLEQQARWLPEALALVAPGRAPLTYSHLYAHVVNVNQTLRVLGLHRHDRVALVLPNGPEAAAAFLTVAASVTCAPLNPLYSAAEFDFYLAALRARAILLLAGLDSPVRAVARGRGVHIIELHPQPESPAGLFALSSDKPPLAMQHGFAQPDDVALVLHTSGTTSQPKVVPLTHRNICTSASDTCRSFKVGPSDRCLNVLPLFHIFGLVGTLLTSLMSGAGVVCAPGLDVTQFFAWMAEFRPTWYAATPMMLEAILAHAAPHHATLTGCPLRFIRCGSAPLPLRMLVELERVFNTPVTVVYGMTETASQISCNPLPPRQRKPGSVGLPAGPEVAIMDDAGTLLPAGAVGEIVVRGASVTKGYDNDPEANRLAFRQGWFRTGDAGFLDVDGYLFVVGRFHEIIRRGGTNIAPWEIDEVLLAHPAVAQAVTFPVPDAQLGEDVAAAVVLHPNAAATAGEIRQLAAARLTEAQVPTQVLLVEAIPLGANGKLQRAGLAEQFGLLVSSSAQVRVPIGDSGPHTPTEDMLISLWRQVLGLDHVNARHNFFQAGGDSLLATQLISRIREAVGVEISFQSFLEMPTIAGMARSIEAARHAVPAVLAPPMQRVSRHSPTPLSYAQQRLWLIEQLGLSAHAYHLLSGLHMHGPLCVGALRQSFEEIVRRHEVLRTTFTNVGGQPLQVIGPAIPFRMSVIDLRELPHHEQEVRVQALAHAEIQRPFDLTQGPLIRATLARLTDEEHVLLLAMHHIISDGWSHDVFWRELAVLYEAFASGKPSPLPAPSIQYVDFADWQRQWLQGEVLDTQLAYWKQQLADVPALQLPADYPRPAVQTFRGARYVTTLSPTLTQALKALSQRHGGTLFMTLLAAFQVLLHRYTGQDDIAVGSLIANRNRVEVEGLIGFFVNILVLRTDLSGDPSFRELLERVREVALGAYAHQDVPYEKLLEELRPPRDLSRNPLFQVMIVLHNTPQQGMELPGLTVTPLEIDPGTARFDLTLEFWETPEGLRGRFEYSTDLFEAATIARMAGHLQTLLEGIAAEPEQRLSRLPLLTADERQRLLVECNSTAAPYPDDQCIHNVFEAQVNRTPDAVAVVCGEASLTYRELNQRSNQVAHYLMALGIGKETLVGLCIERSLAMVAGLLGILKAGAAYVPLDPTYPSERLAFMLEDARPPVVLTQESIVAGLPVSGAQMVCLDAHWPSIAEHCHENPIGGVPPDNLAYVLYTSGSTGQPKGVLGVHRATLNALAWMWRAFPLAAHDVCCQKTSISFGDSIQELLGPLLWGTPLVLIPDTVLRDLLRFVQTLAERHVTRLTLVPSLLRVLLDTFTDLKDRLPSLRLWFAGGEALPSDLWQRFRERLPDSHLVNLYGASEASDDTTSYDTSLTPNDLSCIPIGRPIANTQVYVLDPHLQPVPLGVSGELYVGGAGLTRGYLNHPELTAERFIPHPFSSDLGARLYKSGDSVRYRTDGNLEYMGRLDHQVKLRGVRIELGEIEAALAQYPAVREAVVVREDIPGEPHLVAYVVASQEPGPSLRELRRFLTKKLPSTMVPAAFVILQTLPLTPSGKVNRQALPLPGTLRPALEDPYVAPCCPVEQQVAALWCHLLGLEQVGIHDSFFELGGHSLLAMQLLSRVRDTIRVQISLLSFFEAPTVAGMVAAIANADRTDQGRSVSSIMPIPREGASPASIAQEHFWHFDQMLPGLPLFNIPHLVRLQGALNVELLQQSFHEVITRHEALRTTFADVHGQLVQVIAPTVYMPLLMRDLRALPEVEREEEARRVVQEESQRPFDLRQGPLLRGCLLQLSEQEHLLLVTLHHIISDGWSLELLVYELAALYGTFTTGVASPLPALPIQYADFASWQRQWRDNSVMEAQLAYWQAQLHDPLPVLALPTDRPRGTATPLRTARQPLQLPAALVEAVKDRSQQEGSTLFMTCLAAFKILLYGYTGQEDQRVATLVANRTRQQTEGLIGLLVNTVILRTDLSGNPTSREVLERVRATTLAAYANQDLPFEELVRTLERERNSQRRTLCQVMVVWQNSTLRPHLGSAPALRIGVMEQNMVAPHMALTTFDLVLILRERRQGITGTCIYKTDLFDEATISRMVDDFQYVLEGLSVRPEQALKTFRGLRDART